MHLDIERLTLQEDALCAAEWSHLASCSDCASLRATYLEAERRLRALPRERAPSRQGAAADRRLRVITRAAGIGALGLLIGVLASRLPEPQGESAPAPRITAMGPTQRAIAEVDHRLLRIAAGLPTDASERELLARRRLLVARLGEDPADAEPLVLMLTRLDTDYDTPL